MKTKVCMLALLMVAMTGVARANTITVSGGTAFTLSNANGYNYNCRFRFGCFGFFPHSSSSSTSFSLTLPSLPHSQVLSANLSFGGLVNASFFQGSNGDNWFTQFGGGFSSITVGSVTDPLFGLPSGTLGLTDPALLAALGTGAPIHVSGFAGVFTSPTFGNANPRFCGISNTCFSSFIFTSVTDTPFAQLSAALVPEPQSLMLVSTGLLSIAGLVRRRLRR